MPFSVAYATIQLVRAALYRIGILKTRQLHRPVVSVGNLTVGGTGKTPVTAYIARFLMSQGMRVAVLSRGYGGSMEGAAAVVSDGITVRLTPEQCGDEPFLLAQSVPGLMVVIGADRYEAGLLAGRQLSPDIYILDDGFQHLRLHRDLDLLLLDCIRPFGNGWTLPGGLLREPMGAVSRAGAIIYTRCPDTLPPEKPLLGGTVIGYARHQLTETLPLAGGAPVSFAAIKNRSFVAFAGIAEPHSFFDGLRSQGLNIVATVSLPDHTVYSEAQFAAIKSAFSSSGADSIITTEKDGVKLRSLPDDLLSKTFLARLELVLADPAPLSALLLNLLQK